MDVEEYFAGVEPKGKRSRLEPYWPAIQKARANGYTLDQIVGFLQNNSVEITRSGLFAFIKRKEIKESTVGKISKSRDETEASTGQLENNRTVPEEKYDSDIDKLGQPDQQSLDEVLKSRGAVFDEFEQNKPTLENRFKKQTKGTK